MPRLFSILTIISIITTRATAPMPIPIMRKGKDEPFVSVGCRSGMVVGVGGTAVVAVAGAEVGVVNVGVSIGGPKRGCSGRLLSGTGIATVLLSLCVPPRGEYGLL